MLLDTKPPPATRRSRRTVAYAAAGAAVLAMMVGATALHRSAHGAAGPAQLRSHSLIPWSQVGDGWTLLQELDNPPVDSQAALAPDQLLLIDPRGTKYRVGTLDEHKWGLTDWDHRHQRALLVEQWGNLSGPRPTEVLQLDLRTGAEQRFTLPGSGFLARYGPDGQSIVLDERSILTGYSLTGQLTWTLSVPSAPTAGASFASTPDRRRMIANGAAGLNVYDPTSGQLTGTLPAPDGFGPCTLPRWQADGKLTAICTPAQPRSLQDYRAFVFSVAGAPAAGRVDPAYPAGWTTVTGFRDGSIAMAGPLIGGRLARIDSSGHTAPVAVPAQFTDEWGVLSSNADGFLVAHLPKLGAQITDRLVRWNPFTGKVVNLFDIPGQVFFTALT